MTGILQRLHGLSQGPIARATVRTSAVLGLRLVAQAATLLIVARMLGPASFGAFAGMASLAVVLGALTTFGTHLLLLREVSSAPDAPPVWLARALATSLVCGTLLLLGYLTLTLPWLRPPGMQVSALVAIGISDILALPLLLLPASMRQGMGQIARSQLLIVLPQGLRLVAACAVLVWQPADVLTAYAHAYALAALACLPIAARTLPHGLPPWREWRLPSLSQWRETSGFAALNLSAMGPSELDKTVAMRLIPATAAGTYAAGTRVLGPLVLPVLAMMLSALPRLFREHAGGTHSTRLFRATLLVALLYGMLAAVTLWLAAPFFVWLFGTRYAGLATTLHWLALAVPGLALWNVVSNLLLTHNHAWMRFGIEIGGLLTMGGAAFLLRGHAERGMALALAGAEYAMVLLGLLILWKTQKIQT